MSGENKFLIGFGAVTLLIIVIGAFFLGRQPSDQSEQTNQAQQMIDQAELINGAVHTIGNADAPVTIVEFADLQCPACRAAHPTVKQVIEAFPEDVYYVWRHYPLTIHRNAKKAAQAAEAAGKQEKFFEMADLLFINQPDWQDSGNPEEYFNEYAEQLQLNLDQFEGDMENLSTPVESDFALGNQFSVNATPTFFINGERIASGADFGFFESKINQIISQSQDANTSEQLDQQPLQDQ